MFNLMQQFVKCYDVEVQIVVASMIYIDRLLEKNGDWLELNESNILGFLQTSLALASKFYLDKFEKSTLFFMLLGPMPLKCKYGASPFQKLIDNTSFRIPFSPRHRMRNMLDIMLELLSFDLNIQEEEYLATMKKVKSMIAQKFAAKGQVVILESSIRRHTSSKKLNHASQDIAMTHKL
jgi:hypothetical protein